jgi:hypothetical protein
MPTPQNLETTPDASTPRRPKRVVATTLTVSLLFGLGACAPRPGEEVEEIEPQAETLVNKLVSKVPAGVKTVAANVKGIASIFSDVKGAVNAAIGLAQMLGLIQDTNVNAQLEELKRQIDALGVALDWKLSETWRADQRALMRASIDAAKDAVSRNYNLTVDGTPFHQANVAVNKASEMVSFYRYAPDTATSGEWQGIIRDRADQLTDPEVTTKKLVYDWRYGVPQLMALITQELAVMGAADRSFLQNHRFDGTIERRRTDLKWHYEKMLAGVRCGFREEWIVGQCSRSGCLPDSHYRTLSCADIYSGTYSIGYIPALSCTAPTVENRGATSVWVPPPTCTYDQAKQDQSLEALRRAVERAMPLFEMKSLVDQLYVYRFGTRDLTELYQRIPLAADPSLCLDVQGANPARGTPVWLWPCYPGAAQQWVYNRRTGKIFNPAYNKCLDVQGGSPLSRTPVWTWDCVDVDAQRWTYDPETRVLTSALGTALDVQGATLKAMTPLWTWWSYGGAAQQFRAD